ncbi:hypothetical protein [Niallia nealsonii]|uniref:Uncharacterized protein n=1 Tax=Niallia nealsonii TaxID=115979 RepID=A0A2N0Z0F9_9BACI|nr:hypothetical protein [Niallia nealsonii]PKG22994.1 hypothetical protein CWS01_15085 [Niallia nealsonii]
MVVIQYFENRALVTSKLVRSIPAVNEDIKLKGRKGKVLSVKEIHEKLYHIHIVFEKVVKNQPLLKDTKKKRR